MDRKGSANPRGSVLVKFLMMALPSFRSDSGVRPCLFRGIYPGPPGGVVPVPVWVRRGAAALLLASTGACGSLVATPQVVPDSPRPMPSPRVEGPAPEPSSRGVAWESEVLPRPPAAPVDPIVDSPWTMAEGMEEDVRFWLESFQTREAELMRAGLTRMGRYREMVQEELSVRRLPESLAYLPIVESWYIPTAISWVGAGGLWQFMAPTARGMGLEVNRLMDERRDPYLATPLALDFLAELHGRFGSWFLALAAYNGGPGRLQRVLRRHAPGAEGHDGLFLEVRRNLPRETRNFVPRFLAAALIARDPAAYGFGDVLSDDPLVFDVVEVPDATSLDVVARAAGVGQQEVEALNPQLLRGFTPAGVETRIKLPAGSGPTFRDAYSRIPPDERVTFLEHYVASGETLTHIARDHGVSVGDLQAANPRIQPRRMQIGQRVVVPKSPSAREALRSGGTTSSAGGGYRVYRVRSGDTLSAIASRNGVSVRDLLSWNDLTWSSVIHPGDEVRIYR